MRRESLSFRFVFVLGLALGAFLGVTGRAAAQADPKVTMELVKLVTPEDTYKAMIGQMTTQMLGSMQQSGGKVQPDVESKMGKVVMEALPYSDLTAWTVEIYAARFTTDEIKALIAFYQTPVGKKAAKMLPEISGEIGKKLGPVMMQRLPAAMKKVGLAP